MSKVFILRGLPGSGKSTWRKEQSLPYVNKDEIRLEFPNWNERQVHSETLNRLNVIMMSRADCIVDNTNLNDSTVNQYIKLASDHGYEVEIVDFRMIVPVSVCIENDLARKGSVGYVGEDVIKRMALENDLLVTGNPDTFIFDIDGTLARTEHRTHLLPENGGSWDQFFGAQDRDPVFENVAYLLRALAKEHTIICVSGRPDTYRAVTRAWLARNNLPVSLLLMRRATDKRPDYEVKRDIYNKVIRGNFNVKMIFDDRNSVVEEWRKMGLTCAQTALGDF